MVLHTVNKSPASSACLAQCLRFARQGSAILLLENGVYAALDTEDNRRLLAKAEIDHKLYVLTPDVEARGIGGLLSPVFEHVDYAGFVALCAECTRVQNWY